MTDHELEELMKSIESNVSEQVFVISTLLSIGPDRKSRLLKSAELLDDMSERLRVMASNDRQRARKA